MLDVVVTTLKNDATLAAMLTGGVYDQMVVGEISRQSTPDAFDDDGELLPCALVSGESATPWGPMRDSGRVYFLVWLYQMGDSVSIEGARTRVYKLLHRQKLSTTRGIYGILHANDVLGIEVTQLAAQGIQSRFVATIQR